MNIQRLSGIVLFGPDGAGKTTVATIISDLLRTKGTIVIYDRIRAHHLYMYLILKLLQKIGRLKNVHSPRYIDYIFYSMFYYSKVYAILELLTLIIRYCLTLIRLTYNRIIWRRAVILVAERSLPDSLVVFALTNRYKITKYIIMKIIQKSMNKGFLYVYLYANPKTLIERKIGENLSLKYVRVQLMEYEKIYLQLKNLGINIIKIDTSKKTPKGVVRTILSYAK